jgi:hypothetical protein
MVLVFAGAGCGRFPVADPAAQGTTWGLAELTAGADIAGGASAPLEVVGMAPGAGAAFSTVGSGAADTGSGAGLEVAQRTINTPPRPSRSSVPTMATTTAAAGAPRFPGAGIFRPAGANVPSPAAAFPGGTQGAVTAGAPPIGAAVITSVAALRAPIGLAVVLSGGFASGGWPGDVETCGGGWVIPDQSAPLVRTPTSAAKTSAISRAL